MTIVPADAQVSLELTERMLAAIAEDTPPEVAVVAALTVMRFIAAQHPDLADRISTVLSHTAAELITGQLFAPSN